MSFRTMLLLSYAVLVVAVLGAVDLCLNRVLSTDLLEQLDRRMAFQANVAVGWLIDGESAEKVVARGLLGAEARITILGSDNLVLADSAVGKKDLLQMGDHGDRPEVVEARQQGVGRATRYSSTLRADMRYVATRSEDGRVVRVAVPLSDVSSTLGNLRLRLLWASFLALAMSVPLAFFVGHQTMSPVRTMTEAAVRLARGEAGVRFPLLWADELGVLARSLSSLAGQLAARIGELTCERDRLSAMLEGMVEGVIVVGPGLKVVIANSSAARILDTQPSLVGLTLTEAVRPPLIRERIEAAAGEHRPSETTLDMAGLAKRAILLTVRPLSDGAVAVLHDVTPLRRLETMRRDFVSNVSHELRTPITAIQAYSETLLDGGLAEPTGARSFVEVIHRNASRLGRLVADLLRLSKIEARSVDQIERKPVNLKDVVEWVVETLSDSGATREVKLSVDVPDTLVALGESDGIEQMVLNLVDNAIKYGRQGGSVKIHASAVGRFVDLSVEDEGPGIESCHLPRIFERFYRGGRSRSDEYEGTGLGLSIVKHLAESSNGTVLVDSEVGRGSRFTIRLPLSSSTLESL